MVRGDLVSARDEEEVLPPRFKSDDDLEFFTDLALNETQRWIETVTHTKFSHEEVRQSLRDGRLLCLLLESLQPGLLLCHSLSRLSSPIAAIDNLLLYLAACEKNFGLEKTQLFDPADLVDDLSEKFFSDDLLKEETDKRLRRVACHIYWLGKNCRDRRVPPLDLAAYQPLVHDVTAQRRTNREDCDLDMNSRSHATAPFQFVHGKGGGELAVSAKEQLAAAAATQELREKARLEERGEDEDEDEDWRDKLAGWSSKRRQTDPNLETPLVAKTSITVSAEKTSNSSFRRGSGLFKNLKYSMDEGDPDPLATPPPASAPLTTFQSHDEDVTPERTLSLQQRQVTPTHVREAGGRVTELVVKISQQNSRGFGFTTRGGRDMGQPLTVDRITAGSAADQADVREGDEIASINGETTALQFCASLNRMLQTCVRTGQLEMTLRRYELPANGALRRSSGGTDPHYSAPSAPLSSAPLFSAPTSSHAPRPAMARSVTPPSEEIIRPTAALSLQYGRSAERPAATQPESYYDRELAATLRGETPPPVEPEVDSSDAWLQAKLKQRDSVPINRATDRPAGGQFTGTQQSERKVKSVAPLPRQVVSPLTPQPDSTDYISRGMPDLVSHCYKDDKPRPNIDEKTERVTVSSRDVCAHCEKALGSGPAMSIQALNLFYHVSCFRCSVCAVLLGTGEHGTDVRVKLSLLHCQNCNSSQDSGLKLSKV